MSRLTLDGVRYHWTSLRIHSPSMGRREQVSGGRKEVVCTRLSEEEEATLDRLRGALSRAVYIRLLIKAAGKRGGV